MSRYIPSRNYWTAGVVAFFCSLLSAWFGLEWWPSFIPSLLFLLSGALLVLLATRPPVVVRRDCLIIGRREIPWEDVRRIDRTAWRSPLVLRLTLKDESRLLLIYAGEPAACRGLLSQVIRSSGSAMIDGVSHPGFWLEASGGVPNLRSLQSPKYPLLREEDEAEVERLYQMLKTVGHIDPKNADEQ